MKSEGRNAKIEKWWAMSDKWWVKFEKCKFCCRNGKKKKKQWTTEGRGTSLTRAHLQFDEEKLSRLHTPLLSISSKRPHMRVIARPQLLPSVYARACVSVCECVCSAAAALIELISVAHLSLRRFAAKFYHTQPRSQKLCCRLPLGRKITKTATITIRSGKKVTNK